MQDTLSPRGTVSWPDHSWSLREERRTFHTDFRNRGARSWGERASDVVGRGPCHSHWQGFCPLTQGRQQSSDNSAAYFKITTLFLSLDTSISANHFLVWLWVLRSGDPHSTPSWERHLCTSVLHQGSHSAHLLLNSCHNFLSCAAKFPGGSLTPAIPKSLLHLFATHIPLASFARVTWSFLVPKSRAHSSIPHLTELHSHLPTTSSEVERTVSPLPKRATFKSPAPINREKLSCQSADLKIGKGLWTVGVDPMEPQES